TLTLEKADDILAATVGSRRKGAIIVGFALETEDGLLNARKKLESKKLDLVVLNLAGEEGSGFGSDTNRVIFLDSTGAADELPMLPKTEVAERILDRVEAIIDG